MTNTDGELGLISLENTNTENFHKGIIFCSEHGTFECIYGFRPIDMEADIFCYTPSVGFKSKNKDKDKCFIKLEFGAPTWTYNPNSSFMATYIANNLFTSLPTGASNYYGIFHKNRNLNKQATIAAFGFTFEELEEVIQAYSKAIDPAYFEALRRHGFKEGRITFSKTRDNACDLTGNTIPREFPYITFEESKHNWSHISLIGFYSHLSLLMRNGSESPFYQIMLN
jgi:hypothetical protein